MDGLPTTFAFGSAAALQQDSAWGPAATQWTLKAPIGCVGVGLHSGRKVSLKLLPAPAGTGIVFRRTDLDPGHDIPARFDRVVDTRLCTVVADSERPEIRVGTVEHLMAAFVGSGVHNAVVLVDGPEVPILDGSAASFLFLIDCAGIVEQDAPVVTIEVLRRVRVAEGEAFAELRPTVRAGFSADLSIDFEAGAIGRQAIALELTPDRVRAELARARTFTNAAEVRQLQAAGLALGGSLDNAVVVDGDRVLNPGGLRMEGEFVRHKLLDAVGDLALAGAALRGRFVGHRTGHTLNNRLLRALFADDANWRPVQDQLGHDTPARGGWHEPRLAIAAAPV